MTELSLIAKLGIVVIGVLAVGLAYFCVKKLAAPCPPEPERAVMPVPDRDKVTDIGEAMLPILRIGSHE